MLRIRASVELNPCASPAAVSVVCRISLFCVATLGIALGAAAVAAGILGAPTDGAAAATRGLGALATGAAAGAAGAACTAGDAGLCCCPLALAYLPRPAARISSGIKIPENSWLFPKM